MGHRKVVIKESVAEQIASIAWFIESKGMVATADRFIDSVYDFFLNIADETKSYAVCKEPVRASAGFKCVPFKKKYTIVFIEADTEIVICEFLPSKLIYW